MTATDRGLMMPSMALDIEAGSAKLGFIDRTENAR